MEKKSVLVLSDNELLSRVVELALDDRCFRLQSLLLDTLESQDCPLDTSCIDLVVLALGSSRREPVVALTKTSLTQIIGRIPLVVISNRRFEPARDIPIYHLDFPFDVRDLRAKVNQVMFAESTSQPVPRETIV